jgi:hypothetical protein
MIINGIAVLQHLKTCLESTMKDAKITRRTTLALGGAFLLSATALSRAASPSLPPIKAYRNPGCGCCEKWAAMLQQNGFALTMEDDADLATLRTNAGVPSDLAGCHTAFMGDYIIEGHVPLADIMRLVIESPKIKGIAVAGMPMGSPGMEMDGMVDHYDVVAFGEDGKREVFSKY